MPVDGKGGDAPPADGPETQDGDDQAVTILEVAFPVGGDRKIKRGVHEFDAEVEGTHGRDKPVEPVEPMPTGGEAGADFLQPIPISLRLDQTGGVVEVDDPMRQGRLPHLDLQALGEGADALRRDPVRGRAEKVVWIFRREESKPAPIGRLDHAASALGQVRSQAGRLVEDVAGRVRLCKRLPVGVRPQDDGEMLQDAHSSLFLVIPLPARALPLAEELEGLALLERPRRRAGRRQSGLRGGFHRQSSA
jgi:hypothetical protein